MEETTTTEPTADQSSGVHELAGLQVDAQDRPITSTDEGTQLETAVEEAGSQPPAESQDTGENVDNTADVPEESDEIKSWAEKKNLPLDDPIKMAKMVREAEQKMHSVSQETKLKEAVQTPPSEDFGVDPIDEVRHEVQQLRLQNQVSEFYNANPEARQYDAQMAELVQQKPYLANDLESLYAVARFNELSSDREAIKQDGGREALTKLAQKQQTTAVKGNAVTPELVNTQKITPENVDRLVAQNDQKWFEAHYDEINQAMQN